MAEAFGVEMHFEVDSLLQQYRWGDDVTTTRSAYETSGIPKKYTYGYYDSEHNTNIPLNTGIVTTLCVVRCNRDNRSRLY